MRPEAMPLVGSTGLVSSGTSSGGSFERYDREGMANVVPSHVLIRNLLTLSLQSFLSALETGHLEQVHRLRGATDLLVDVSRVGGLGISVFRASFDNIYQIVNVWGETTTASVVATFNLKIKNRRIEVENRFVEIADEKAEQLYIVAKLEHANNDKKVEIAQVVEQIAVLRERMSQLNKDCGDLEGIFAA